MSDSVSRSIVLRSYGNDMVEQPLKIALGVLPQSLKNVEQYTDVPFNLQVYLT